jgi:hypothetical protein
MKHSSLRLRGSAQRLVVGRGLDRGGVVLRRALAKYLHIVMACTLGIFETARGLDVGGG